MVGESVMTQRDIQTDRTKPDPIGMGSYNSDSHNVQRIVNERGFAENEGDMQVPVEPYQIPYRMLLPKRGEVTLEVGDEHFDGRLRRKPPRPSDGLGEDAGAAIAQVIAVKPPIVVRDLAGRIGKVVGQEPRFVSQEADTALLSNASTSPKARAVPNSTFAKPLRR